MLCHLVVVLPSLDISFPSRMKTVESPATLEEKTHSPQTYKK